MVGTLRSTGCENCRKRKKKCGEELPECIACANAGWKCPGYAKRYKFVDENAQLTSLYKNKKYLFEVVDEPDSQIEENRDRLKHNTLPCLRDIDFDLGAVNHVGRPLNVHLDQICGSLCYILDKPQSWTSFPITSLGTFFSMIPSRLGRNIALDDSISCLCSIYTDWLRPARRASKTSIQLYTQSLKSLRKCLDFPDIRTASETICASIILQVCELITNDDMGRWNRLCMGSKLLIQESDPSRFLAPFERSMLESQRAWFIVQDANAGQKCFLSNPEWRNLLSQPSEQTLTQEARGITIRSELCDFLVEVPSLVEEVSQTSTWTNIRSHNDLELMNRRWETFNRIATLQAAIEAWHSTRIVPRRSFPTRGSSKPTTEADEIIVSSNSQTNDDYSEILIAVVDCVSSSVMVKLDLLMADLLSESECKVNDTQCSARTISARQVAVSRALNFVRAKFQIAAKPLEFGLRQLWLNDDLKLHDSDTKNSKIACSA